MDYTAIDNEAGRTINTFLEETIGGCDSCYEDLENLIKVIKDCINIFKDTESTIYDNRPAPYYDRKFKIIEQIEEELELNLDTVQRTQNALDAFRSTAEEFKAVLMEHRLMLNKNKLDFGLQGQLKKQLRQKLTKDPSYLKKTLGKEYDTKSLKALIKSPYQKPGSMGGKTHRRKRKNKSRRHK